MDKNVPFRCVPEVNAQLGGLLSKKHQGIIAIPKLVQRIQMMVALETDSATNAGLSRIIVSTSYQADFQSVPVLRQWQELTRESQALLVREHQLTVGTRDNSQRSG